MCSYVRFHQKAKFSKTHLSFCDMNAAFSTQFYCMFCSALHAKILSIATDKFSPNPQNSKSFRLIISVSVVHNC